MRIFYTLYICFTYTLYYISNKVYTIYKLIYITIRVQLIQCTIQVYETIHNKNMWIQYVEHTLCIVHSTYILHTCLCNSDTILMYFVVTAYISHKLSVR